MLQQQILREVKIPVPSGCPNKFLAKMVFGTAETKRFYRDHAGRCEKGLWPRRWKRWWVGRKLAPALKEMGVETIGQLASMPKHL